MPMLSICMPSRRNWAEANKSIQYAVHYIQGVDAELVISDNSGDPHKQHMLQTLYASHPQVRYLPSSAESAFDNWFNALQHAQGDFISFLSDDDILVRTSNRPLHYPKSPEVAGYQPNFAYLQEGKGLIGQQAFGIDADSAVARLRQLSERHEGNNSSLFIAWDGALLKSLFESVLCHHPLKPEYGDWATVHALTSCGKLIHDPDSTLFYARNNWSDDERMCESIYAIFDRMGHPFGLGRQHAHFMHLLMAVDAFIYINRQNSPLPTLECRDAANYQLMFYLQAFKRVIESNATELASQPGLLAISQQLAGPGVLKDKLDQALLLIDRINPQLAQAYQTFYARVVGAPWAML